MSEVYVIMGPAGCGKSSIAAELATRTNWTMIEADDHHPLENVEKQRNCIPLTDTDRSAWLDSLIMAINLEDCRPTVLACSALTSYVQERLRNEVERPCKWLLIDVRPEVLKQRMTARREHFMPVELLESQLSSLRPPANARLINGDQSIAAICDQILDQA